MRAVWRWRRRCPRGTSDYPDDEGIIDFENDIDGSGGSQSLYAPAGGSLNPSIGRRRSKSPHAHYVHQEGQAVFKYAVRRMADLACGLLERNGLKSSDLALVVPHQANLRIIRAMQERLGVDDSKVLSFVNIDRFGNTTAASDSPGINGCRGAEAPAQRGFGSAYCGVSRVHHGRDTSPLGLLKSAHGAARHPRRGARRSADTKAALRRCGLALFNFPPRSAPDLHSPPWLKPPRIESVTQ